MPFEARKCPKQNKDPAKIVKITDVSDSIDLSAIDVPIHQLREDACSAAGVRACPPEVSKNSASPIRTAV
jgi:hypothetical protein